MLVQTAENYKQSQFHFLQRTLQNCEVRSNTLPVWVQTEDYQNFNAPVSFDHQFYHFQGLQHGAIRPSKNFLFVSQQKSIYIWCSSCFAFLFLSCFVKGAIMTVPEIWNSHTEKETKNSGITSSIQHRNTFTLVLNHKNFLLSREDKVRTQCTRMNQYFTEKRERFLDG